MWDVLEQWRQSLLNINTPDCRPTCGRADCYELVRTTRTETPRSPIDVFAAEFLELYRDSRRPGTARSAESQGKLYAAHFGQTCLSKITTKDVEEFKAIHLRAGKAPATVNRYLQILSQVFSTAVTWGQAQQSPAEHVISLKVQNARTRFLSEEEELRLLAACGPSLKPVVQTALHTGCR